MNHTSIAPRAVREHLILHEFLEMHRHTSIILTDFSVTKRVNPESGAGSKAFGISGVNS